ncbi:MAG: hypothetical protein MJZ13_06475 [Bacteroidales bacterium]|nr:hypothetical protein [Bacteroidales bacterium]
MAELSISPAMQVAKLQKDFKRAYGASLRVYKGQHFADKTMRLCELSESAKGTMICKRGLTVEAFEKAFVEKFGVKVQVATPDNSALSKNTDSLVAAGKVAQKA